MFNDDENRELIPETPETEEPVCEEPVTDGPIEPTVAENAAPSDEAPAKPETPSSFYEEEHAREAAEPVREYPTQSEWSEPRYVAAEQHRDYYSPSAAVPTEEKPQKPKKERRQHPVLRAIAIVLACAILSGATSYGVVNWVLDRRAASTQVVLGSQRADTTVATDENTAPSTVSAGAARTANEIYSAACDYQVVGVNTSVNTRNYFGATTNYPISGSGFVISEDGYIMTNYHVISYAVNYGGKLTVMFEDGTSVDAEIIGYSEDNDVAVIKIDPTGLTLKPVVLGDSDAITVGEQVYAIGNPLGELVFSMTPGIVSALDRVITTRDEINGSYKSINMFQISAAVNSGNSGGPVYNSKGEVIGIVTAKYSDSGVEGLGFAIPVNDAVGIAKQLIEKGYVTGASLGITCYEVEDMYSTMALQSYGIPDGVLVNSANSGSAAEKAGLRAGDIITAVNGTKVTSIDELKMVLRSLSAGDTGTLTVYRMARQLGEGETLELTITFDESEAVSPSTDNEIGTGRGGDDGSYGDDYASSWGNFFGY